MAYEKIRKAELISGEDNKELVVQLKGGSSLVGHSLGIEPGTDSFGEDTGYDVLAFKCNDLSRIFWLKEDEIQEVSLAG